jgi:hypothetical protein
VTEAREDEKMVLLIGGKLPLIYLPERAFSPAQPRELFWRWVEARAPAAQVVRKARQRGNG